MAERRYWSRARRRQKSELHRRSFIYLATLLGSLALATDAWTWLRPPGGDSLVLSTGAETLEERRLGNSTDDKKKNKKSPLYFPDVFIRKKNRGDQGGNKKFVFLHALGVIYMFLALMIVCDNFFGPALDCMVEKWDIDDDVAGATFMAAGGSAPELATSYMGQFVSKSDIGFGTIVGSAVFNVLFVIACCAVVVPDGCVPLTWWPLFRDCSYYILGLLTLAMFVRANDNMVWYEALLLFSGYIGYVTIMRYNHLLEGKFANLFHAHPGPHCSKVTPTVTNQQITVAESSSSLRGVTDDCSEVSSVPGAAQHSVSGAKILPESVAVLPESGAVVSQQQKEQQQTDDDKAPADGDDDEDDGGWEDPWAWPETPVEQVIYVVCAPLKVCLYMTLYDCSHPDKQKYFLFTFGGSLVWLSIFAYAMVVWTTVVGASLGICDYIMGLTVLAAGTSIPDALSSMYMAREGRGDMAISSSIGSNVFDILVGLPIPVLTKYFFVSLTGKGQGAWSFQTDGIVWDTITLLCMVAAVVSSIAKLGWVLNLKLGAVMFLFYFVFIVLSIARNWKSCTRQGNDDD